jgi:signal transduction histidine kinase
MNIKLRLSFQFTFIVAGILLFFSLLVYYFSYTSQLSKFRQNLLDSAKNTATLLINVTEVDSSLLQKIQQSTISWEREEMVLTDSAFKLIYGNNIQYLSDSSSLANYINGDLNYFSIDEKDGVFYKHIYDNQPYYVYAMAFDKSRIDNLSELRKILLWGILFSIWLSVLLSYLFARRAIKPISQIIKSVKEINSLKLSNRLDEGDKKDEIAQLAITFNQMLSDLEIAFKNQEDFVSNASHELRTPLTVMIGESEYILNHDRSKEDFIKHVTDTIADLRRINTLINNLLELAQIGRNKTIIFLKVRIDEVIFNSIYQVKAKYQGRKIVPKILYPESENALLINGSEGLLTIAFQNLIDNACKFSNDDIIIDFVITDKYINIIISDRGIGIPTDELGSIYRPFSRASNVKYIGGFGIGLALVSKILELHKAVMDIKSKVNEGTRIEVLFRRFTG